MSTRKVTVFESAFDQTTLAGYNYCLNVAKRVVGANGQTASNVVWKSLALAPNMSVSWDVKYALNWTADVLTQGASVSIGGNWKPCDKGQVYDLDNGGRWQPSSAPADPDFLNVGKVGYQYPGVLTGIHILVGVLNNATQQYETIYADPVGLPLGASAKYQPLESIDLWYSSDLKTSAFNISHKTNSGNIDASSATAKGKFEWWATFKFNPGTWGVSDSPPPATYLARPKFSPVGPGPQPMMALSFEPLKQFIKFAIPVVSQAVLVDYLLKTYSATKKASFEWEGQDGTTLGVTLSRPETGPPSSDPSSGSGFIVALSTTDGGIDGALKKALADGVLPAGETWTIT
ncbi:hypothetical protein OC845_006105 [Tilletia horrida]|nr:hypothetical protein OC845_006105 [Tilletia horrida]